jgi:MYXO-CTERM domain-containing protein
VPPKQGGCGCKTAGAADTSGTPWAALGAVAVGAAWMRRRRRRA